MKLGPNFLINVALDPTFNLAPNKNKNRDKNQIGSEKKTKLLFNRKNQTKGFSAGPINYFQLTIELNILFFSVNYLKELIV